MYSIIESTILTFIYTLIGGFAFEFVSGPFDLFASVSHLLFLYDYSLRSLSLVLSILINQEKTLSFFLKFSIS